MIPEQMSKRVTLLLSKNSYGHDVEDFLSDTSARGSGTS